MGQTLELCPLSLCELAIQKSMDQKFNFFSFLFIHKPAPFLTILLNESVPG